MSDLCTIANRMREDWNRRIEHDYRLWMSDGSADDAVMWESGERDFALLISGIEQCNDKVFLEIGCGVGRLLRPALGKFRSVIGVDVSEVAIAKAKELLAGRGALRLIVGNGIDLHEVDDFSVDVVVSFAALTSMPLDVAARYLQEAHRVLKPGGLLRAQLYLGQAKFGRREDTLCPRAYDRSRIAEAVAAAGFRLHWIRELILPFQVSFKELGIEAVLVSLEKLPKKPASVDELSMLLGSQSDISNETEVITDVDLELWMAANHARDQLERGDIERAQRSYEFVLSRSASKSEHSCQIVSALKSLFSDKHLVRHRVQDLKCAAPAGVSHFSRNMSYLERNFPQVAQALLAAPSKAEGVEIAQTEEGPTVSFAGQNLDHANKPRQAGEVWARRVIQEARMQGCDKITVFGFGCGYHIEALLHTAKQKITVIEPSIGVFRAALEERDLIPVLEKLSGLSVGELDELPFVDTKTELVVRPQAQAVASAYCSKVRSIVYGKRGLTSLHPTVAVLGPLQGGTLPIAAYTSRALKLLNQRVREWNVSEFAQGYHLIEKFVTSKERHTALIGNYMEMISHVLLESAQDRRIDILLCMAQAPITGGALTELRKQGVTTVLWFVEDFLRFTYWKDVAKYYDFVFTIQRGECIDRIRAAGAGEVHYLPTGCDPEVHRPLILNDAECKRWGSPVSFVGAGYHNRQQLLARLAGFPFKIWGTEWPTCRPFDRLVQEEGRRLTPAEYIKIFNATDININLHSSSERDGVDPFGDFLNPRTFELASTGAFQLVDPRSLLPEAFKIGDEVVTFNSGDDLKDKISYYLEHPQERKEIAARGRERALRDHTYERRLEQMLSIIYSSRYEQLKRREDESPWRKMLRRAERHDELYHRCKVAWERGEAPNLDGLVSDVITGKGKLSETEQKLMFLYHVRKQMIRRSEENAGAKGGG